MFTIDHVVIQYIMSEITKLSCAFFWAVCTTTLEQKYSVCCIFAVYTPVCYIAAIILLDVSNYIARAVYIRERNNHCDRRAWYCKQYYIYIHCKNGWLFMCSNNTIKRFDLLCGQWSIGYTTTCWDNCAIDLLVWTHDLYVLVDVRMKNKVQYMYV